MVERFFSIARTSFGHERNGLQPITLEQILFLRQNAGYWDAKLADDCDGLRGRVYKDTGSRG
ncbi:hypothetical protein F443_20543 [Phytophthora nicotianae P1569]|uniref:HAT C-terminal dimerisation domain-containing protein n=1 Tax=Phytophthora nicotianae P1569 TaxID=1317065 RepID=V9E0P9_PHYNI|nr:hypothetical protein F443_20543 [Phytophthora nicotianae P1569]